MQNTITQETKKIMSKFKYLNKVTNMDWKEAIVGIPSKSIDMVATDPPYGIKFQSNYRKVKHQPIQGDDSLEWVDEWVEALCRVCKDVHHLYVFCSFHNVDVFKKALSLHFNVKNILIWEKNNTGMGDLYGNFAPKYEMIIFCSNGKKKLNGRRDANIIKFRRTLNKNHPTEKPVNLMSYLIEKSTKEGDVVLDTFAGSFSTARACKEKGRNFICFEIKEEYCKIGQELIDETQVCFV